MPDVSVRPAMLKWAIDRSGLPAREIARRFPNADKWIAGKSRPTLRQLEGFAKATRTPIGFLFLKEPPKEPVPIPDFRRMAGAKQARPSPDLLETIYLCQLRQDWFREYATVNHEEPLPFVGSAKVRDSVEKTAAAIGETLGFDLEARRDAPTWSEALRLLVQHVDQAGILLMVNGIVGNNTHRPLRPEEFRGFALSDALAPLIFVNGADTKSAQMFTIAHELAHLWLGESALSDADLESMPENATEAWCNRVAAELLVPAAALKRSFRREDDVGGERDRLAREFKVSTLVVLRRLHDIGKIPKAEFVTLYEAELARLLERPAGRGGDFYRTQGSRVGRRFAAAIVASTLEGQTPYTEAMRLLSISKVATLHKLGAKVGVV
jgi:Zn-dependent peptidase ImmA (M78 family)